MEKVLVAEDDAFNRELMAGMVESLGHIAIRSSDGHVARHILDDNDDIALLITDVCMPEIDGLELLRQLRADPRWSGLPVIVVSGVVKPSEIGKLLDLGASRFMGKPIHAQHLRQYILDYLGLPERPSAPSEHYDHD